MISDPGGTLYALFGDGYVPYNTVIDPFLVLQYTASGYYETLIRAKIQEGLPSVLYIDHTPRGDSEDTINPYPLAASFICNYPFAVNNPAIMWNTTGVDPFTTVVMTQTRSDYEAVIPAQPSGTTVYYYITAQSTTGRTSTHPLNAPSSLHDFYVGADTTPPVITHTPHEFYSANLWPMSLTAVVTDNIGVGSVTAEYRINGGTIDTVTLSPQGDNVYTGTLSGTVAIGDLVEYRIIASDQAASPNQTTAPEQGFYGVDIIDRIGVLLYDADPNASSAPTVATLLDTLGISTVYSTSLVDNLDGYASIFVFLGMYSTNYQLSADEGTRLAQYLDNGGRLYMEGGDTWYYDPDTQVHPYFHIQGTSDGAGDAGPIAGVAGTFTQGMNFNYGGANNYVDHLAPIGSAVTILTNTSPVYNIGIMYDSGTYKTVGVAFEFAGLTDGSGISTKQELLYRFLQFFDVVDPVASPTPAPPTVTPTGTLPSPTRTPTITPTAPPPTSSPTPIDSVTPTATSTQNPPTSTPLPDTPTPGATPTHGAGGPYIEPVLNQTAFTVGDRFLFTVIISNWSESVSADEYIILEVFGLYFFWPTWTEELNYETISIPANSETPSTILDFEWPSGAGSAQGLSFWTGLLTQGTLEVLDIQNISFEFY